jgi:hypothetical protein
LREECPAQPPYSIDPLYPHWFGCDLCGQDVAGVLPAEQVDLVSLTAQQVAGLWLEAAGEIDAHEHDCPVTAQTKGRASFDPN